MQRLTKTVAVGMTLAATSASIAGVGDYTENFDADNANWADGAFSPTSWSADGGPQGAGDGFISSTFDFSNAAEGDFATFFRGHESLGSSGGAFSGDWIDAGVSQYSFWVRHDFVAPLFFFNRFATAGNFPAVAGLSFTPVLPDTWTEITIDIDPNNPLLIPEGGPGTYEAAFGAIGNLQVGLEVPAELAGWPTEVTFDLDAVSVTIPAPASLALLGLSLAGPRRRR